MTKKLEKLDSPLFKSLTTEEMKVIFGGAGFTKIGRTQHGDHIDNDYAEDA
jgi:hypothetical protein